jgi:ketopantoate reductase
VDVRADHVEAVRADASRIDAGDAATTEDWGAGDGSMSVDVAAATDPGYVPDVDLVVVFVTSTATATAVADAA